MPNPLNRLRFLPFKKRIAVKLALILTIVVVGLLLFLGILLMDVTENVLKDNVKKTQKEIAVRASEEISLFVRRPLELLKITGEFMGRTGMRPWDQETVLVQLSLDFPLFEDVVSVGLKGRELAVSNPGRPKKDWHSNTALQHALGGSSYVSTIRIGADHLPHISAAIPYFRLGKVAGVLIAQINLRGLWNIVDNIRIGETGRAFLISKYGLVLAHPDKTLVLKNHVSVNPPPFPFPLKTITREIQNRAGKSYLCSYARVDGPMDLVAVIQMETREAYRLIHQMHWLIWLVVLISFAISVAVSFFLANRLVLPVKSLEIWSKRVSLGDYNYQVPAKSVDEIGRLLISFKRMSQRLKKAKEKEHLAALGETASTISHKLKNSIVSLKTYAQLFPQRKHDPYFIQKFEANFSRTIDYLEKMFKNLSQLASYRKPEFKPLHLAALLTALPEHYDEIFKRRGIECQICVSESLPIIDVDTDQVKEVFDNLIQNAIQAMPEGGRLEIGADRQDLAPYVEVRIEDTGVGIPGEHLEQIFKPFFSTKHDGMGLGLAIVKKVVEDHGGSIQVESWERKGTVFKIRFPIRRNADFSIPENAKAAMPSMLY